MTRTAGTGAQPFAGTRALFGAAHLKPSAAMTILFTAMALATGRDLPGTIAVAAAVLTGQLSIGWLNDLCDVERDRMSDEQISPSPRAISRSRGAPRGIDRGACLGPVVTGKRIARWSSARDRGRGRVGLRPEAESDARLRLIYVVPMGLSPLFVVYGLPGSPRPPWWLPVVTILLGCGTHFANVLRDLDDDLAIGVRGLPQRLGAPVSRTIAVVLTFGALVLLVVVAPLQPAVSVIALIAAVAVLALGFGTVREVGSERPFRAVAVVGLLTVGLLISVGPALH